MCKGIRGTNWKAFLWIVVLFLFFPGDLVGGTTGTSNGMVGTQVPLFTATTLRGNRCSLESLTKTRKVLVVNFWGLRCAACIEEMPHLDALRKKFGESIEVLGVNVDGIDGDLLKEMIRDLDISVDYEIVPDPEFKLADLFGMTAAPLTVVIDSSGTIRYRHEDFRSGDEKEMEGAIRAVAEGGVQGRK